MSDQINALPAGTKPDFIVMAQIKRGTINFVQVGYHVAGENSGVLVCGVPFLGQMHPAMFQQHLHFAAGVVGRTLATLMSNKAIGINGPSINAACKTAIENFMAHSKSCLLDKDGHPVIQATPDGEILAQVNGTEIEKSEPDQGRIILPE